MLELILTVAFNSCFVCLCRWRTANVFGTSGCWAVCVFLSVPDISWFSKCHLHIFTDIAIISPWIKDRYVIFKKGNITILLSPLLAWWYNHSFICLLRKTVTHVSDVTHGRLVNFLFYRLRLVCLLNIRGSNIRPHCSFLSKRKRKNVWFIYRSPS